MSCFLIIYLFFYMIVRIEIVFKMYTFFFWKHNDVLAKMYCNTYLALYV